jgi:hypothetical protein
MPIQRLSRAGRASILALCSILVLFGLLICADLAGRVRPASAAGGLSSGTPQRVTVEGRRAIAKLLPSPPREQDCEGCENETSPPPIPIGAATPNPPPVPIIGSNPQPKRTRGGSGGGALSPGAGLGFLRDNLIGVAGHQNQTSTIGEPSEASAGNVVMYTGNWYAAVSSNGGATFSYINPYTTFPASFGGFCCDQTVHYSRNYNLFIWQLQYSRDGAGNNIQRIAVATPDNAVAGSWTYWDIASSGVFNGNWFDFPSVGINQTDVFMSSNMYTPGGSWQRAAMFRFPLSDLADYGGLSYWFWSTTSNATLRLADDLDGANIMFWASHNTTSQIRVFWWQNSDNTVHWNGGTNLSRSWTTNYATATPDGWNWLGRVDSRMQGGTRRGNELWWVWTAGRGGDGGTAYPYAEIAVVDATSLGLISQPAIAFSGGAVAYPAVATNGLGEIGYTAAYGGAANFPSQFVGFRTGTNQPAVFSASGSFGPSRQGWGDYFAIRRHFPQYWLFSCSGMVLTTGNDNPDQEPVYTVFGRDDELGDGYEMDDTRQEAKGIGAGDTQTHSIHFPIDNDWVTFTLAGPSDVTLATGGSSSTDDTRLWIYDANGGFVAFDDDSGPSAYSLINQANLPAGTYYGRVDEFAENATIGSYTLSLTVTAREYFFTTEYFSANESAGSLTQTVARSGNTGVAGSVDYNTVDWTAAAGADYTSTSVTLSFPAGSASQSVTVPIVDDDVLEGTEYFYGQVTNPANGSVGGQWYGWGQIFDNTARPAPSNLALSVQTTSRILVKWLDNCSNEANFELQTSTDGGATWSTPTVVAAAAGTGTIVAYSKSGLTVGTTYTFRVRAVNGVNPSDYSPNGSIKFSLPAAPTGINVIALSTTKLRVSVHDQASNESGFRIERSTDGGATWPTVYSVGPMAGVGGVLFYTNTGLTPATTYTYRVRAWNGLGNSAYLGPRDGTTQSAPADPDTLTATRNSSRSIKLTWIDRAANEQGFKVDRSTDGGATWPVTLTLAGAVAGTGGTRAYINSGLTTGVTYTYRVRAYNDTTYSGYSNTASATP